MLTCYLHSVFKLFIRNTYLFFWFRFFVVLLIERYFDTLLTHCSRIGLFCFVRWSYLPYSIRQIKEFIIPAMMYSPNFFSANHFYIYIIA